MVNLFAKEKKDKKYLNIILNDEEANLSFDEIFDTAIFDTLSVITFVSSQRFFFEKTKGFKNVTLILGIEDNDNLVKFYFNPTAYNDFYKNLDQETIEKIKNKEVKIFFSKLNTTIHSKIYILSHTQTNRKRVMLGSANFTETAFNNQKQYEEIIIYDDFYNSKIVEVYSKRFNEILEDTIDFIPERIKKKIQQEEIKIFNLTDKEQVEILAENLKKNTVVALSEDLAVDLDLIKKENFKQEEETKKKLENITKVKEVIEIVTKNKNGSTILLTPAEITKKEDIIIAKVFKTENVKKEFEDNRVEFFYDEQEESIFKGENNNQEFLKYPKELTTEEVKKYLELLNKFIQAYSIFTVNKEQYTQFRVFEAILYAFAAPYIWKIREEFVKIDNRKEVVVHVPLFMLIAGQSNSGKSHLLNFISHIIGNLGNYYNYQKGSRLSSLNNINPQMIDIFFNNENLMPIFVDEIDKEYFCSNNSSNSNYMGESYIKNITNSKEGKYPALIATSNTDFSGDPQVMKRIYYIQINNPFDKTKEKETSQYFNDLKEEFKTDFYRDFLARFERKLKQGIEINYADFLKIGREIFEEYFTLTGIEKPEWFSKQRIDDYYLRGKEMWQKLYKIKKQGFVEIKKDNEITINDEIVFGNKMSVNREKKEWLNYLPTGIIIEEKGIVRLNREKFLFFIGEKENLFKKVFFFR